MVSGEHVAIDSSGKERPTASRANVLDEANGHRPALWQSTLVGTMTVRHTWLEAAGAFDESLAACEDWDLWLRLSRTGCQIAHISEPVMAYRSHAEQMTQDPARMRKASLAVLNKIARGAPAPYGHRGGAARGVCLGLSAACAGSPGRAAHGSQCGH